MTYRRLDQQSDWLALRLIEEGVCPGDPVGVVCRRCPEMIVGLLAILKAGGFYLPFDVEYPAERLRFMALDSGVKVILGEGDFLPNEGIVGIPFGDFPKDEVAAASARLPVVSREDAAYLLYTSGTTGEPKGVLVPHRAILRLVMEPDFISLGPATRMLQHSPVAFDASTLEIWGPLLNGGELVLFPEAPLTLRRLGESIGENGINTIWLTAGLFHAMVDERMGDLSGLEQLLAGGDVLSPARAETLLKRFPALKLINGYGPTENTTFTCCHRVSLGDATSGQPIPIGKPIAGTEVHLLNEEGQPVEVGERGELCAGGQGLALRYWKRKALNTEKFIEASWDSSLRLYRTGDQAWQDEAGVIHFEGRQDQQVKIRGFRIELAEIEAALESHEAIQQGVVTASTLSDGADKVLTAWVVADQMPSREDLLCFLEEKLPDYAIPAFYRSIEAIPLTPNGKIDRLALTNQGEALPQPSGEASEEAQVVQRVIAEVSGLEHPSPTANFFDLGLSSLQIARAHEKLEQALGRAFSITAFFQHTTIQSLNRFLKESETIPSIAAVEETSHSQCDIAIVGMAGRFPGAATVDEFWEILLSGQETISHFTEEELDYSNDPKTGDATYVRARGIVEGSDLFDAKHFGIPPRDAELLDPQHRLLLECAQEVLEDAGHDPDRFDGKIGFFAGSSQNSYLLNNLVSDRAFAREFAAGYPVNQFGILFGNDKDFLPTRIAYKLNLKGPAMAIQCACSTSLMAVAQACESLRSGTSDMALAGGVSLTFPQKRDYLYTPEGMASTDGHCRSFDAEATGTVFGEGVGLVALRRLDEAIAGGDEVIAVIKGYAQNNDGADKAGYAAPSVSGQVEMILEAHRNAGVSARSIGYLEAHGTGTPLGDPIEVAALTEAFSRSTSDKGFCGLGTAKTNVGHLDIAAGVTGLIKAALTLKHGVMPPLVHFQNPNPKIDFDRSALFPIKEKTEWKTATEPRRAGVSALGVGGTNVHVVLEEAPVSERSPANHSKRTFFPLSASSPEALGQAVERLGAYVSRSTDSPEDVAFTLQEGRRAFEFRTAFAASSLEELSERCRSFSGQAVKRSASFDRLAFLFPGQGAQHPGMARELYEQEIVFREVLDRCAEILQPDIGANLIDLILPQADQLEEMAGMLRDTSLAQPAIFSVSYALARQWQHWGIEPDVLIGHSIGEFAAATFAGVFELSDALHLIAKRGRLMSDLPGGVMISVRATEEEIQPFLDDDFDLAAVNGKQALVVAGPHEATEAMEARLEEAGLIAKRLHTSHAFHSRMMDPIVSEFEKTVSAISLQAPTRCIFSTVQVDWLSDEAATDPTYWAAHLRKPVRFYDAIAKCWEDETLGYLEVGPGNALATLAGQNPNRKGVTPALSSLPHPAKETSSHEHFLSTAANLWSHGWRTDWSAFEERGDDARRRVSLPTYPFQRSRFWVEPPLDGGVRAERASEESPAAPIEEVAPVTQSETDRLKKIFSDLSGLNEQDLVEEASFLELGLDSLLLTQASRELQEAFGVAVTLRELIDTYSTIGVLAEFIKENRNDRKAKTDVVALTRSSSPKKEKPVSAPALKIHKQRQQELSARQRAHLDDLIHRYTTKTATSKALTAKHRKAHADPRTASGFNREWKEMVYQIVTEQSKGSRLLDVDGNEYVDILNGFGPGLLGHSPDFLVSAIEEQLHLGFEVGPNQRVAMEAAELFCEVTGNERTSFVCTGSEAVQASMRLARTVTGRDKIVIFARDYHGNFDEVLVRGVNSEKGLKSLPMAPGIPKRAAADMVVLPYGTDESLSIIRQLAGELAAVIVEPVQSRRPEFSPREFIREVREITRASGTLFVFDEVVTGFRFGPGGAQDFYGIDADLATYGKVVGGGMPIGVVSGKAMYMDTFDGGDWRYGDDSFPEKPVTFFAGTFVRHPLAMASLKAMLGFFREQPLHFWQALNAKGDRFAGTVNQFFKDHRLPYELPNCGSLMFARVGEDQPYGNLLFYHLRERGVFMLEGFPSYLTASHTDGDLDFLADAFIDSAAELQEAGFYPESEPIKTRPESFPKGPAPCLAEGKIPSWDLTLAAFSVPTTQPQREIVVASALSEGASCAFNESASLIFDGELDEVALIEAIGQLADRHDAFRATFSEDGSFMRVHRHLGIDFARGEGLEATMAKEARQPFDLTNGPLMRMRLVEDGEKHVLVMTAHHAIVDGWSYNVIAEELSASYNAIVDGGKGTVGRFPEPKQYATHAREQQRFGASQAWRDQQAYWVKQFESIPSPIELPLDRAYPVERTFSGGTVEHPIGKETYLAVKAAGAKQGATLYGTLSAVFALFLHRLTSQDEIVYCIPAAGQNDGEHTENLVGHCVNFLPLRSTVVEEESFGEFLKRNRVTFLEATDHRSYTYGELIRDLRVPRDPRRMPLSEVAFNLERMDYFGEWAGLEVEFCPNPKSHVHYTLFLNVVESDEGLRLDFDYNGDVLDESTVRRWAAQFEALVRAVAKAPQQPASEFDVLTESDREKLLVDWSGAKRVEMDLPSIPAVFSEVVERYSDRVAVKSQDESFTYSQLDVASNRVASSLQEKGIERGDAVGLLADRSSELIASLLGILKAGASYVPIDPTYPASRIDYMLTDSAAKLVLTDRSDLELPCEVVTIEDAQSGDAEVEAVELCGEDLAYIIYTSGSTGLPKGTLIPHRGVVRLVRETDYIRFGVEETFLLSSPVTFDASTLELWGSLLNGGKLGLMASGTPSLAEIGEAIREFDVTTLWLTSGLFQLMVDERLDDLKPLRQLLVGGDVVSKEHAARAIEALAPTGKLFNGYGPTENTTFTTVHPIAMEDTQGASIPIGFPIAGTSVYLLDDKMNPVSEGAAGRLYIGGAGLSLGYLNQEELSSKSFVQSPFEDGALLYDSGDQARWRNDGSVEFLGRADDQVKIRGFRIETGEIETTLCRFAGVQHTAVVVIGDSAESKTLCAFLQPTGEAALEAAEVLKFAKESLPSYMVPNRVIVRAQLPITANGKVDYRALKQEASESKSIGELELDKKPSSRPATETERLVASLWEEILKIESVSREDDFFELGGHSLAGLRLFTRLQDRLSIDLPFATLFRSSTVTSLSEAIDLRRNEMEAGEGSSHLIVLIREGDPAELPLFLVHGGDGGTLFYKDFSDHFDYPGSVYTIESSALVDPHFRGSEETLLGVASRYIDEVKRYCPDQSFHLGRYSFGGAVAYEMACQLEDTETSVETLLLFDTPNPVREHEFKQGLGGRLVSEWRSQESGSRLSRVKSYGARLIEGVQNKVEYLGHLRSLREDHGEALELPENLKLLKIQELHRQMLQRFAPKQYHGPVVLFRAMSESGRYQFDDTMGWNDCAEQLIVVEVPGNHETIFNHSYVGNLGIICSEILDDAAFCLRSQ